MRVLHRFSNPYDNLYGTLTTEIPLTSVTAETLELLSLPNTHVAITTWRQGLIVRAGSPGSTERFRLHGLGFN